MNLAKTIETFKATHGEAAATGPSEDPSRIVARDPDDIRVPSKLPGNLGRHANPSPERCPALVLNADYRPLSYFPLSIWNWQTSLKAVFLDRVTIVSHYEQEVRSPSISLQLPSVIALKKYVRQPRFPAFTRFNLFLRDQFTCQYCGATEDLTFDHVIPRRAGGRTSWTNITAACAPCNLKKGGRTPEEAQMFPKVKPYRPTTFELHERGRAFPPNYLHESWRDYLYWDAELDG